LGLLCHDHDHDHDRDHVLFLSKPSLHDLVLAHSSYHVDDHVLVSGPGPGQSWHPRKEQARGPQEEVGEEE
jgi:hypothetical protein